MERVGEEGPDPAGDAIEEIVPEEARVLNGAEACLRFCWIKDLMSGDSAVERADRRSASVATRTGDWASDCRPERDEGDRRGLAWKLRIICARSAEEAEREADIGLPSPAKPDSLAFEDRREVIGGLLEGSAYE